jgi:hypothetical protein
MRFIEPFSRVMWCEKIDGGEGRVKERRWIYLVYSVCLVSPVGLSPHQIDHID